MIYIVLIIKNAHPPPIINILPYLYATQLWEKGDVENDAIQFSFFSLPYLDNCIQSLINKMHLELERIFCKSSFFVLNKLIGK